jgi:DNA-binding XRE family transcriptional regulator
VTHSDNIADAVRKGRMGKKLTPEDVLEIRRRLELGETQTKLAQDFPVTKATIGQIARRETWRYLTEPNEATSHAAADIELVAA